MKGFKKTDIKRRLISLSLLGIFIVSMFILPNISVITKNLENNPINTTIESSYNFPGGKDDINIGDWVNLSEQAAQWLENNAYKVSGYSWNSSGLFYMNKKQGSAGIGLLFLELYQATKNVTYLNYAKQIGDYYNNKSPSLLKPGKWPEYDSVHAENYTGYEIGAAGVGTFLYKLYEYTNNATILNLANDVSNYIQSVAVNEGTGTKYPKKESIIINNGNKTFNTVSNAIGTGSGSVPANLQFDDGSYYQITSTSTALSEKNLYRPGNTKVYTLSNKITALWDCTRISQQFRFDCYPVSLSNGLIMMLYRTASMSSGRNLRVAIYEAKSDGTPNMTAPVGGFSNSIAADSLSTTIGNNVTFTWSSGTPVLNGTSTCGYCLVLDMDGLELPSTEYISVVATNNNPYSKGRVTYDKSGWKYGLASDTLIFNITDSAKSYGASQFGLNLTEYGIRRSFETQYIKNITLLCRAFTSASLDYAQVSVYNRAYGRFDNFGTITSSEQLFSLVIDSNYEDYLTPLERTIYVRVSIGHPSSTIYAYIDVLNVTLNYNDEYYGVDYESGVTGIGMYFLDAYESTFNDTYLERARKIGNYLISIAEVHSIGGTLCAAWKYEDGKYYTGISKGMAGIGSFLSRLASFNNTDTTYRYYAKLAANWLIKMAKSIAVFNHLNVPIGTGMYWNQINTTSSTYTGMMDGVAGIADFLLTIGFSETEQGIENTYLDAAIKAGNFLISSYDPIGITTSANQSVYTYVWSTISYPISSVDLSLYSGTAGVLQFLNNLYRSTHISNFSTCVSGAYEYFRMNANNNPSGPGKYWNITSTSEKVYSLGTGVAGVALSLLHISFSSYKAIQAAEKAAQWLYSVRTEINTNEIAFNESDLGIVTYSGLMEGTAGVGLTFLNLYRITGNISYFNWASYCAKYLENQNRWNITQSSTDVYYGIKYGVSGIGLFFLELAKTSSTSWYSNALKSMASFIINNAIISGDQYSWTASINTATQYYNWDFGAAGILYFLTEMYKLYHNSTYLSYAEGAARWLDANDVSGSWKSSFGATGDNIHGFSDGSAGIAYSLLNLYELTKNSTYLTLVNLSYTYLDSKLTDAIPRTDHISADKYNSFEFGQAGMVKFFARYYDLNKSADALANLEVLNTWFSNKQEANGSFSISVNDNKNYYTFNLGVAGVLSGLIDSYSSVPKSGLVLIIDKAMNYLVDQQDSLGFWDDETAIGEEVPTLYGSGVAGIIDQLIRVPDLSGPSLDVIMNISISTEIVQYYNSLEVNVSSIDSGSGLKDVILAYSYNNGAINEFSFVKVDDVYRLVFPNNVYNTNVTFYIVSIDNSGILNIDDNSGAFYKFTYQDTIDPIIGTPITYDAGGMPDKIQYKTGGRIVAYIDEPTGSSGVKTVSITYDNTDDLAHPSTTTQMLPLSGHQGYFYIDIPGEGYDYNDNFQYNITVVDNANNIAQTGIIYDTIGDNVLPTKTYTKVHESTKIPAFQSVNFAVGARDGVDIDSIGSGMDYVYINYTTDNGNSWRTLLLIYDSDTGYYEGTLPGQNMGVTVAYMICLVDRAGNVAYYDSQGIRYSSPMIPWLVLYKYDVVINWTITILVIVAIAAVIVLGFYLYNRKTDYWDKMRSRAGMTASMITIQEKLTNIWYGFIGRMSALGNWIMGKFRRPPGMPNPLKEWYEEHVSEGFKKIFRVIGRGFKAVGKFLLYAVLSPFTLIAALVKNWGSKRALMGLLLSLLLIIFSLIKFISDGVYPLRALFFINFGMILFIASFLIWIFHLVYRISYK